MHYMPKQETGSKPMLLHCKNKGRTQHSSSHRKHTPVCWTILQKLWNGRKEEGKNWFFSLSTSSLLYHLPQIGFYPTSFHAPHLHHILTLLPHFSSALLLLSCPLCLPHCTVVHAICLLLFTFLLHQTWTNPHPPTPYCYFLDIYYLWSYQFGVFSP